MQTLREALENSAKPKEKKQADARAKSFRTLAKVFGTCVVSISADKDGAVFVTDSFAAIRLESDSQEARDIVSILSETPDIKADDLKGRFKVRKSGVAFSFLNTLAISAESCVKVFDRAASCSTELREFESIEGPAVSTPCIVGAAEDLRVSMDPIKVAGLYVLCSSAAIFAESAYGPVQFRDGARAFAVLMPLRVKN